jgi:glucoamylase
MSATNELETWITHQARRSAAAMEQAISASRLIRRREAFNQIIIPAAGSVLASPTIADWNPEPDYFFHWLRDSAIVMRAVAELMQDCDTRPERERWRGHFENFVQFSLALSRLDGAAVLRDRPPRQRTQPESQKFLRSDAEIAALTGDALLGEPRFNPDGTIDVFGWSRPQYDGPALRALACLHYLACGGSAFDDLVQLLQVDLDFTLRHAGLPCIGPWEEPGQNAHHYYVALVQLGALVHGRAFVGGRAQEWERAEQRLRSGLDAHWSEQHQVYMAMRPPSSDSADAMLDAAVLLAVLDADLPGGAHSASDPRIEMTQTAIEALFARELPINHNRPTGQAPALGRYYGDRYFGGGAWYPTTLAAAGLYYRRAQERGADRDALIAHGDRVMATVRALTPSDGALSEQVGRVTGAQTSARHLTWSYAAFINTARLRARAAAVRRAD